MQMVSSIVRLGSGSRCSGFEVEGGGGWKGGDELFCDVSQMRRKVRTVVRCRVPFVSLL